MLRPRIGATITARVFQSSHSMMDVQDWERQAQGHWPARALRRKSWLHGQATMFSGAKQQEALQDLQEGPDSWGELCVSVLLGHRIHAKAVPTSDMGTLQSPLPGSQRLRRELTPGTEADRHLQRMVGGGFTFCPPSQGAGGRWSLWLADVKHV